MVGIAINASGNLVVALQGRLSFEVAIPQGDDYYLVLDNRHGVEPVKATATVKAVLPKSNTPPQPAPSEPKDGKFERTQLHGRGSGHFVREAMPDG